MRWKPWAWWATGAVGLVAGLLLAVMTATRGLTPSTADLAPPSNLVAVLPFSAAAPDEAFSDAMSRDVSGALSRSLAGIPVVSYNASAAYPARSVDSKAIAQALNVRYLVEAEVERTSSQVIVNMRLVEPRRGRQVANRRIETAQARLAEIPDLAVLRVTSALRTMVRRAETRRVLDEPSRDPGAYEMVLRAEAIYVRNQGQGNDIGKPVEVIRLLEEAARREPNMALPLYRMARLRVLDVQYATPDREQRLRELEQLTLRAISLGPEDARAWDTRADVLLLQQRWDAALAANATAIKLDPTDPELLQSRAHDLMWVGRPADSLPFSAKASEIASDENALSESRRKRLATPP